MDEETLQLGGNIQLTGFRELERGMMVVLKKIVGNYARKMSDQSTQFESLSITMKKVHEKETGNLYEIHSKMIDNGKIYTSEETNRNIFLAIDTTLKKIMTQLSH